MNDVQDLVNFIKANRNNSHVKAKIYGTKTYEGNNPFVDVTALLSDEECNQIRKVLSSLDSDKGTVQK